MMRRSDLLERDGWARAWVWFMGPETAVYPRVVAVAAPMWIVFAAFAGPALWLWWPRIVGIWWKGPGLCWKCGYDRAGLAEEAKCPECGATSRREAR
jgi:hypothetical protein